MFQEAKYMGGEVNSWQYYFPVWRVMPRNEYTGNKMLGANPRSFYLTKYVNAYL